jgi:hypothetical protein
MPEMLFANDVDQWAQFGPMWLMVGSVVGTVLTAGAGGLVMLFRFLKEMQRVNAEEAKGCRDERSVMQRAHAEEREIDRKSRGIMFDRMQAAIADNHKDFREALREILETSERKADKLEGVINRQTDSITGVLRSQTESLLRGDGKKKRTETDFEQTTNDLKPKSP